MPHQHVSVPEGKGHSQATFSSAQQQDQSKRAETQDAPCEQQGTLLCLEGSQTLAQHRLPSEVAESPLEMFKTHSDKALGNLL